VLVSDDRVDLGDRRKTGVPDGLRMVSAEPIDELGEA
jgi:hypothetical protein